MKNDELKTGGPAFPFGQISEKTGFPVNGFYDPGMTLRDYFAAKAMQAIIEKLPLMSAPKGANATVAQVAIGAYYYADAMLAERNGWRP